MREIFGLFLYVCFWGGCCAVLIGVCLGWLMARWGKI